MGNKKIILFARKEECCGCTACYSVCGNGAITMVADDEGFLYPVIDDDRCIGCMKCSLVCPIKNRVVR